MRLPQRPSPTLLRFVAASLAAAGACACGSNNAGVSPDLLAAVRQLNAPQDGGAGGSSYPAPPYGTSTGAVVQDLCFQGWIDPSAAGFDTSKLQKICLSDFHDDPDARLLLVESCAIWCVACKFEYGGSGDRPSLQKQLDDRKSKGFRIMGTIFQDGAGGPAAPADAKQWASVYALKFPFAVDDEHQLGLFTSPNIAPFNLLLDTRTMKVVLALDGDEPAVLFGKVDEFLGQSTP
ncbi:MAG TPA: hypothetical protein VH062_25345 [Polyangiaceae bacterium]|jgi:hypothetical protein|nr:hypothetical protein [Polyangiaceae bacterium]